MDPAKAARQLRSFGVDLTRHHVLALAGAGPSAAPVSLADKAIVRLRRSARRHGWPAIVGVVDDLVLAIVGVPPGTDLHAATDRLTADMDPDSQWGSDTSTDPGQVVRTLRRANEALEVSRAWGTPQRVARWQELILPRLLTTLHSHGLLTTFVEAQLGPVLAHDADAKVKLLPTLAAVIEARGNKSAAAKALHLQRRTLYYRLARIEALLGHPVDTTEDTVALYLALRGLTLLRGQPNTHPSR
jgi:purine catabolism regulator